MIINAKYGVLVASLFLFAPVYAWTPGLYGGAGLGVSKLENKDGRLFDDRGWGNIESSIKQGGLGWKGFVGYHLNDYLGVELGYTKYAISKSSGMIVQSESYWAFSRKNSLNAISLVGKAGITLGETGISLYGLGGGAQVRSHLENDMLMAGLYINSNTISENKFRPLYGAGVGFAMTEHLSLNLELTRIQGEKDGAKRQKIFPNADALMLSMAYQL